jgi:hypothetical protein
MPKSIFLSYSSIDEVWVEQFIEDRWFLRHLGIADVYNYKVPGDAVPFGELDQQLRDKVSNSAAVVLFLSENYFPSRASHIELNTALDLFIQNRIVFVPILLDIKAKDFWNCLKNNTTYKDRLKNYLPVDFTQNNTRRRIYIGGKVDWDTTEYIRSIAETIVSKITLGETPLSGSPPPETKHVIVLGDPEREPPDQRFAERFSNLVTRLSTAGVAYKKWPNAWRETPKAEEERVKPPATFLRIATSIEVRDEDRDPRTVQWINECGRVDGKVDNGEVILWNASGDSVEWKRDSPILRQEPAEALAAWLAEMFRSEVDTASPLLLIIDEPQHHAVEDARYWDVVRMVSDLINVRFSGRSMNAEEFIKFVKNDRHRELIVAVLDNNVNPTVLNGCGPIERFEGIVERWQEEIAAINEEKELKVKVIWVAVMSRLAHLNPYSTWNKKTFEPIHVLRVQHATDEKGQRQYAPDESSAVRVASALKLWMREPAP